MLPPLDDDGGSWGGVDGGRIDAGAGFERDHGENACWNGLDDDGDGIADCSDVGCRVTPFCCLGSSSAGCCGSARALTLDFAAGCSGTDPRSCHPSAQAFGAPLPLVEEGAFVPNGGAISDAGLIFGEPVDATRERIAITAELAAPAEGCRECLDAVGVGVGEPIEGDVVSIVPDVAVLLRAARGDYALVVGGEIIAAAPLTTDAPRSYTLTLAPDGAVELRAGDDEPIRARWWPAPGRRLLLYGRTHNRPAGAPLPARALSVEVGVESCEIPSALVRDPAPLLGDEPLEARAPSVWIDEAGALAAFERAGDIYLARRDASGAWVPDEEPALTAPSGEAYRDPALVRGAERWTLFVTHEREGSRAIARSLGMADHDERFETPLDLRSPVPLSQPAFARVGGRDVIAALAAESDEAGESIVLLELDDDELRWLSGTREASTVVRPAGGIHAFDADQVAAPALYVDGTGTVRLYYAGRRGARWSIGVRAAGPGGPFLYAPGEPVLEPSGEGLDALGVSDPSVVREGAMLHLYHTSMDGLRARIGVARGATRW